jgi:hypothetical protein
MSSLKVKLFQDGADLDSMIAARSRGLVSGYTTNPTLMRKAGITIFNDFSARDAQRIEMEGRLGPAKGKSFDGNVMGPGIVTPDEIGDPNKLKMEVRVNGKMRSQGVSEGMLSSFEEIIEHVTRDETLMPGEFIGLRHRRQRLRS